MSRRLRQEDGFALIPALRITIVLAILVTSIISYTTSGQRAAQPSTAERPLARLLPRHRPGHCPHRRRARSGGLHGRPRLPRAEPPDGLLAQSRRQDRREDDDRPRDDRCGELRRSRGRLEPRFRYVTAR